MRYNYRLKILCEKISEMESLMQEKKTPVSQIKIKELHTFFRLNWLRSTPSQTTVVAFMTTGSIFGNTRAFSYFSRVISINDNYMINGF